MAKSKFARHDGRVVGVSTFRFRKPGIVEYAANVSRRKETRIRQNDLGREAHELRVHD
jgi:hypothetical protein